MQSASRPFPVGAPSPGSVPFTQGRGSSLGASRLLTAGTGGKRWGSYAHAVLVWASAVCPSPGLDLGTAQRRSCQQEEGTRPHLLRGWGKGASLSGSPARCSRAGPAPGGVIIEYLLWAGNFNYLHSNPRRLGSSFTLQMRKPRVTVARGHKTDHCPSWDLDPTLSDPRAWAPSAMLGHSQEESEGAQVGAGAYPAPPTPCPTPMSGQWRVLDGSQGCGPHLPAE